MALKLGVWNVFSVFSDKTFLMYVWRLFENAIVAEPIIPRMVLDATKGHKAGNIIAKRGITWNKTLGQPARSTIYM